MFAFASLVEAVSVEDAPDPPYGEDTGEGHAPGGQDGGPVAALLVEDTGDEETESWGDDIADEDDECDCL